MYGKIREPQESRAVPKMELEATPFSTVSMGLSLGGQVQRGQVLLLKVVRGKCTSNHHLLGKTGQHATTIYLNKEVCQNHLHFPPLAVLVHEYVSVAIIFL